MKTSMTLIVCALAILALGAAPAPPMTLSVQSRSQRPGELVVISIALADASDHVRVHAFDHDIAAYRVGDRAWRALIGIDLEVKPGSYPVTVIAGANAHSVAAELPLVVGRGVFRTRRLTVKDAFVTPPAAEQARIEEDARLLAAVWASSADERYWSAAFARPVPGAANSAFGTRSVFNGQRRNPHGGADFLSGAGTPVHAPNAGRVVVARDLYFSGNTVVIDHGLGLFSMLAHLSAIHVQEGDAVAADQVVGLVGATGRVTGPHLHWAVRAGNARIDPLSLLALLGQRDATPKP
jgi:murein DD-endopeptidase MepM/ murein hydrolase activator NlpD